MIISTVPVAITSLRSINVIMKTVIVRLKDSPVSIIKVLTETVIIETVGFSSGLIDSVKNSGLVTVTLNGR